MAKLSISLRDKSEQSEELKGMTWMSGYIGGFAILWWAITKLINSVDVKVVEPETTNSEGEES